MEKNLRLKEARDRMRLTQEQLADKIGVFPSYIAALEGEKGYGYKTADKLSQALGVSANWLLKGEEMTWNKGNENVTDTNSYSNRNMQLLQGEWNNEQRGKPYYNITMLAKIEESFLDIKDEPEYYIDAPPFTDCTSYIQIYGENMIPVYSPGMIVGIKEVANYDAVIPGKAYYIITKKSWESMKIIFNVFPNPMDPTSFIMRSANPLNTGDLIIPKSAIASMHIVKGRLIIDNG